MIRNSLNLKLFLTTVFLTLCLFSGLAQSELHEWTDKHYENYTFETFKKLKIVNQEIDPNNIDYHLFRAAIFYATNVEREKHNKSRFKYSPALGRAAHAHSINMAKKKFYSHTSPVKGRETLTKRLAAVGIYGYCGENIYLIYENNQTYWGFAQRMVKGWMNSNGHKRNILDERFKYLGCGVYQSPKEDLTDYIWVKATQNFCSRDVQ